MSQAALSALGRIFIVDEGRVVSDHESKLDELAEAIFAVN
jgi:hypothetical protein